MSLFKLIGNILWWYLVHSKQSLKFMSLLCIIMRSRVPIAVGRNKYLSASENCLGNKRIEGIFLFHKWHELQLGQQIFVLRNSQQWKKTMCLLRKYPESKFSAHEFAVYILFNCRILTIVLLLLNETIFTQNRNSICKPLLPSLTSSLRLESVSLLEIKFKTMR